MLHPNPTEPTVRELAPRLPQWWTPAIEASWNRARAEAINDWRHHGDRSIPMSAVIEEHALAFGHGARSAFPHHPSWEATSAEVQADWIRLGNVGPAAWDKVAALVHHEWRRAAGPGGDAGPSLEPPAT